MLQALLVRCSSRFFLCCAILLIGSATFAQHPKVLAPHVPVAPKMARRHPLAPSTLQSAVGGLWMTGPGMKSSLYLTNGLKTDPLTITPILHLNNGLQYSLSPVTLQPQETAIVDVNQGLGKQGIAPYATLYGYAEIQYQWPWAIVCATVRNVDVAHSLIFMYELQQPPQATPNHDGPVNMVTMQAPRQQSLEGMWWKHEPGVSGFLAFSNVTGNAINASLRLTDNQDANLETYHFVVSPHGTKMVNFTQMLSTSAVTGGIYVAYDGPDQALLVNGGLEDLATGYSAHLPLFPSAQASQGRQQPELSQTAFSELGLMSGPADPMMMFPAGTKFTPYSIVRNISDQPASLTPTLWWMAGGAPHSAELPAVTVAPHRTVNLDVSSLIAAAGLRNFSGSLNVVLDTKAQPGALTLASGSVDQNNSYVFEVIPHGIGESGSKSLSYWSTGNGDDTMVTVWNPADEPQDFVFTLFYSAGQYAFPLHLESRATRVFNISELIRNQTPDAQGSTIPLAIHEGSAEIAGSQGENQHILVAMDAGTYNVNKAICGVYCQNCNGYVSFSVYDDPFGLAVGGTKQEVFSGQWGAGGQYDLSGNGSWSSSNGSVATVGSAGLVNGGAVGSVTISVSDFYNEPVYYPNFCTGTGSMPCPTYQHPSASGGGNVMSLTCSPSSVTRGNSATCTVNDAPSGATFSNWKFTDSNNTTVTRGGNNNVSSWSGTLVTTGTVSVTVNSTPLSASITVNNRNWHLGPASPVEVANGTFITLPVPPQPTGNDSGLGYSSWHESQNSTNYTTINDGGPNQGYTYWPSNLTFSTFNYQYEINPDLENSGSTFSQHQCGNYDPNSNPSGFISWTNLITQTKRHEYNSSVQSHYAFYSNSLNANNPGDYMEQQVAPPGADLGKFASDTQNGINTRFGIVLTGTAAEPYPVNYSETNVPLGNVNYAPYTACN